MPWPLTFAITPLKWADPSESSTTPRQDDPDHTHTTPQTRATASVAAEFTETDFPAYCAPTGTVNSLAVAIDTNRMRVELQATFRTIPSHLDAG